MSATRSSGAFIADSSIEVKIPETSKTLTEAMDHAVSTFHEYPSGLSLGCILLALALGTFLMALDTTIITVAIPEITTRFNALEQVGWFGSAYLITLTAFQPIAGSWYKCFDPKTTYLVFIVVFEGKWARGFIRT